MFDVATLAVQLRSETHSTADLVILSEALDALAFSPVVTLLTIPTRTSEGDEYRPGTPTLAPYFTEPLLAAKEILVKEWRKGRSRSDLGVKGTEFWRPQTANEERRLPPYFLSGDPEDPVSMSHLVAGSSWVKRTLLKNDQTLYRSLFSFAEIRRISHRSPLLIELAIGLGAAVVAPALLTVSLMQVVNRLRRKDVEIEQQEEYLKQLRIQTLILRTFQETIDDKRALEQLELPPDVLETLARVSQPAASELAKSPLVENFTIGFSAKS